MELSAVVAKTKLCDIPWNEERLEGSGDEFSKSK